MSHPEGEAAKHGGMISTAPAHAEGHHGHGGLKLIQAPGADYERARSSDNDDAVIQFAKHEEASPVELFYDLWFVANLNVFATLHPITDAENLGSFIRYFLMLWITWFATSVYDVRFGADSVFERITRGAHLAVMLGFSAGGVSFSKTEGLQPIYKVMSLCLMCSRVVLAIQYGVVLFYSRHNRRGRSNLALAVLLHLVPAFLYMGATIAAARGSSARVDHLWWAVALFELFALMAHASLSKTLTFVGTHLTERVNLLSLIVVGEGIIILAKTVTKIIQYTYLKDPTTDWSSILFGLIACGAAILYFIFQIYFDWQDHHAHMSSIRQAIWTTLHLPFHIALVLTVEGCGQWVTTRRVSEATNEAMLSLQATLSKAVSSGLSSLDVASALADTLDKAYKTYTFSAAAIDTMRNQLAALADLPDSYWKSFDYERAVYNPARNDMDFFECFWGVQGSLINSIFNTYGLTTSSKVKTQAEAASESSGAAVSEAVGILAVAKRLEMIFIYTFVAAGAALLLVSAMHLFQKPTGWNIFRLIRLAFLVISGVALCLVSILGTNKAKMETMIDEPWQLPIIAGVYLFALIGSHLPGGHDEKVSHHSQMEMGEHNKPSDSSRNSPYHD